MRRLSTLILLCAFCGVLAAEEPAAPEQTREQALAIAARTFQFIRVGTAKGFLKDEALAAETKKLADLQAHWHFSEEELFARIDQRAASQKAAVAAKVVANTEAGSPRGDALLEAAVQKRRIVDAFKLKTAPEEVLTLQRSFTQLRNQWHFTDEELNSKMNEAILVVAEADRLRAEEKARAEQRVQRAAAIGWNPFDGPLAQSKPPVAPTAPATPSVVERLAAMNAPAVEHPSREAARLMENSVRLRFAGRTELAAQQEQQALALCPKIKEALAIRDQGFDLLYKNQDIAGAKKLMEAANALAAGLCTTDERVLRDLLISHAAGN